MIWSIFITLLILWLLAVVITTSPWIHLILIAAVIVMGMGLVATPRGGE